MGTDKTGFAVMDFGLSYGLAFVSSQIVISEGRICVRLWSSVVKNSAVTDCRYRLCSSVV
jgi:hypothetical protein